MFSIVSQCCIGSLSAMGQSEYGAGIFGSTGGAIDFVAGVIITGIGILVLTGVIPLGSIAGWTIFSVGIVYTLVGFGSAMRIPLFHLLPLACVNRSLLLSKN